MSNSIQIIPVHTAPAYAVAIGGGLLPACGQRLREILGPCTRQSSPTAPWLLCIWTPWPAAWKMPALPVSTLCIPRRRGPQKF